MIQLRVANMPHVCMYINISSATPMSATCLCPALFVRKQALSLTCLMTGAVTASPDITSYLAGFVDDKQFFFFASVSKQWRKAWGHRPTFTRVTADTSVSQLILSFECGLGRTSELCRTVAKLGRLDLLRCARALGCPLNCPKICAAAAFGGHLEVLKWLRASGCPWNEWTISQAARGGHMDVLRYARSNGCSWDEWMLWGTAEGENMEVVEWAKDEGYLWKIDDLLGS